jgi:hypothetical protein
MSKRLRDFPINHRLMVVEPTSAMLKLADEIMALQTKYRELEEIEQKRLLREYQQLIRDNGKRIGEKELLGVSWMRRPETRDECLP